MQLYIPQYLYTLEAFKAYEDKLTNGGLLAIYDYQLFTHQYLRTFKVLLDSQSLPWEDHLMVFSKKGLLGEWILFRKSSFTADEVRFARSAASQYDLVLHEGPLSGDAEGYQITTDDRPYLWSPSFALSGRHGLKRPVAELAPSTPKNIGIVALFGCVLLAGLVLLFRYQKGNTWRKSISPLFFIGISLGLASLEFVLINKGTLVLGNPIYTYAIVLAAILCFGSLGSLATYYFGNLRLHVRSLASALALFLVLYWVGLDALISIIIPLTFAVKVVCMLWIVSVPSVIAGAIFPIAFQKVQQHEGTLSLWMWGIDAVAFVVASLVISFAVLFYGISSMLLLGASGYALAAITSRSLD